jgi:hypothetical protein
MVKGFQHEAPYQGESDIWLTPQCVIDAVGPFDLDPCAAPAPRPWDTAANHYDITQGENGLLLPWSGRVWCNPPYGPEVARWMNRLSLHGDGIALVYARVETVAWQDEIWPACAGVLFLRGRLTFYHPDGTPGTGARAPSALVAWGAANLERLARCNLAGVLVKTVNR